MFVTRYEAGFGIGAAVVLGTRVVGARTDLGETARDLGALLAVSAVRIGVDDIGVCECELSSSHCKH